MNMYMYSAFRNYLLCLNHCSWKSIKKEAICTFRFVEIVFNEFHNKSITHKLKNKSENKEKVGWLNSAIS